MINSEREYLATLLESVDCGEYLTNFEKLDITPDLLTSLDADAIRELGIFKVGDRLRLQILVKILLLEKIRNEIDLQPINDSIEMAVKSIKDVDGKIQNDKTINKRTIDLHIIKQDGDVQKIEVNKTRIENKGDEARKRILLEISGKSETDNWKLFYIDYSISGRGVPHEITDEELKNVLCSIGNGNDNDSEKEELIQRLILCPFNETPSIDAINESNKIHRKTFKKSDIEMKSFMGGRPPSQMISTNLHEYFPALESQEIANIKRKSMRLSMYSNKMLMSDLNGLNDINKNVRLSTNRDSLYSRMSDISRLGDCMSMLSVASYGVGKPLKIEKAFSYSDDHVSNSPIDIIEEGKSIHSEDGMNDIENYDDSIIELLDDESEDEEFENTDDVEMITVIDNEITNGPSVWHKGPKIGQGSFGNVYLGLNGLTGELMAIKQVDIPQSESEKSKKIMVNALKQEIFLLKDLRHENIVRYLGSNTDASNMYIFLEYIPGGSVSSMLKMYGPFEEELIRNFTRQVLIGLVYLHSKAIVHRDIKGGNILVDNNGTVKIGDFGISKKMEHNEEDGSSKTNNKRSSLQGSVYWMAPEVVRQVVYTAKADIWSVGCLVVEMFTGAHPYPGLSPMQAIFQIGTGRIQPAVPPRARSSSHAMKFLGHALDPDYITRWTALELLNRDEFVQTE